MDHSDMRTAGREAVTSFRRGVAERLVRQLSSRDPSLLDNLIEVGVINRSWVEGTGGAGPMASSTPIEVVERLLERSVERQPSLLATLGLSAIQVLSAPGEDDGRDGTNVRLAVAFTDLEQFTTFTEREGDDAAALLLADHHRRVGPIVRSRGGRIVKRLGDGLLLTFPEPEAAVLACLELVSHQPKPLRLRAGVHIGEVVVTRDDLVGHVVNVAARVAESATGGEVLVTKAVQDVVQMSLPRLEFGKSRRRTYRGLDESITVAAVTG